MLSLFLKWKHSRRNDELIENISYMFVIQIPLLMYPIIHQPLAALKLSARTDIPESKSKTSILYLLKNMKKLGCDHRLKCFEVKYVDSICGIAILLCLTSISHLFSYTEQHSRHCYIMFLYFLALHIILNRLNQL